MEAEPDALRLVREFKMTEDILARYGLSDDCKACEDMLEGKRGRAPTKSRRARIEAEMLEHEVDQKRIQDRNMSV